MPGTARKDHQARLRPCVKGYFDERGLTGPSNIARALERQSAALTAAEALAGLSGADKMVHGWSWSWRRAR